MKEEIGVREGKERGRGKEDSGTSQGGTMADTAHAV